MKSRYVVFMPKWGLSERLVFLTMEEAASLRKIGWVVVAVE